jgi:DNA-binding transcriptional regulator YbjK
MSAKLTKEERRKRISDAAYRVAKARGFMQLNRNAVATEANCSGGSVSTFFDEAALRKTVLETALRERDYDILQHAMVGPYAGAIELPADVKLKLITNLAQ